MADLEDVTLDGKPLQSLRVADLKAALEERGLSKSGQKNALVKRLKGALMLENLQKTSTANVGLQPNSQIGEEMSQNSFIKQYLAKQQELLRQRLEREAREVSETNEQEDHTEVNNSTPSPAQVQDVNPASSDHHKSPGPSDGEGPFAAENEEDANSNQEAHMSASPASGSVRVHIPGGGDRHPDKSATVSEFLADSDDDDSEDGEDDGDDEDWDSNIRRRSLRQPARGPSTRERCGASCQPQQQHIPSLLSPQLRQPTPPPSPPPELSFPLPDTPKQSPPSPDVAPARRSPSSSSSGSSSSDSRSSSPEPQRSGHVERKPGPLTLLARKMESEGAFSGAGWHGGNGEGGRKDSVSPSAAEHAQDLESATAFSMTPGAVKQGTGGAQSAHSHDPAKGRVSELEAERERLRTLEQEQTMEEERKRALEREDRKKALQLEKELALERERQERKEALAKEQEEREQTLARERALELERQRALEQELLQRQREEKEKELERLQALEREREEREKALEEERLEREKALEEERKEKERIEREKMLEQERLEKEKMEQERLEREKALEQERLKKERALERERALEQERLERESALEQERLERERAEELERLEKEKATEQERLEREKAVEQERQEQMKSSERERIQRLESDRAEKQKEEKKRSASLDKMRTEEAVRTERICEQESVEKELAKELDTELPQSQCGDELGLTPPLSTGPDRKREAGDREDANAPIPQSETQATESRSPMSPTSMASPQSSLKKFRFLRDPPVQPPTPSMVMKRPRTFSDNPPVSSSFGEQKEGHREGHAQQDVGGEPLGPVGSQSEEDSALNKNSSKESFTSRVLEDMDDSVREKRSRKDAGPPSPVDATQWQERDGKRVEKKSRKRSSSDSSSSESDSGSSSSRSSSSSSSSPEKTSISRSRKEGKPERNVSAQRSVTAVAQDDSINEIPKASSYKRERSVEKTSTTDDGASQAKKPFHESTTREGSKRNDSEGLEEKDEQRKEMESAMADSEKVLETSEETPKAFSARKISLCSSKSSPGRGSTDTDQESGTASGRKRRWGSSTVVTVKKPSISITTDSLKSLIPDIKPCAGQDAIVDLYPEEAVLSGAEEEAPERSEQDIQIRRTVTQVVASDSQENGQKEAKRSRREELEVNDVQGEATHEDKACVPEDMETQSPSQPSQDVELGTATTGETIIRRSISQQKTGVSITIDDPVRTNRQPSPPRGKVSNIVHVCNLVRPFTLGQLKELLGRTGTLVEDGFWIDKIKSHCYVTYSSSEEAVATREALHGVKWPQSNPKVLSVDFCQQDELDFHKALGTADKPATEERWPGSSRCLATGLPSLLPERDQWAEREREMERREKARSEREWDRDKVREFGKPGDDKEAGGRRSRSRERRRKERAKSKEKKSEKKEKAAEEPPAKLLDDLFRKTKAAPCIYWLPLTEEQAVEREAARAERMKEREKRLKQQQEEKEKKREEERKERTKGVAAGDRSEGEKDKDRERDKGKERDNDKRRDGYRKPGAKGESGSRRSRSRSDPRDRRR